MNGRFITQLDLTDPTEYEVAVYLDGLAKNKRAANFLRAAVIQAYMMLGQSPAPVYRTAVPEVEQPVSIESATIEDGARKVLDDLFNFS